MTKSGVKTEDYRDLSPYWCNRLLLYNGESKSKKWWGVEMGDYYKFYGKSGFINWGLNNGRITFKTFNQNIMTLGYPKSSDTERILKLEHKGIEIGYGNPEWGAEPNKLYFVIKHGNIIL